MGLLPAAPYPPFLDEAVDHARRLALLLGALDPKTGHARTWLLGRVDEVWCITDAITRDWLRGKTGTVAAVRSLTTYIQAIHRGLALHFGELAPSCCVCSLVVTATPISYTPPRRLLETTSPGGLQVTLEVDERELIQVTRVPSSQ
jgi:hypothetical protein